MQLKLDFMNGQCFNFAYTICQVLKKRQSISDLWLTSVLGTRDDDDTINHVCIHCMAKIYDFKKNCFVFLDSQGVHPHTYPKSIAESWQSVELEITGVLEEIDILEYTFDKKGVDSYWADLERANAKINPKVILLSEEYIFENNNLFSEIIFEHEISSLLRLS
jgi:hypothetical protein